MQRAVDIVGTSPHPSNKIAATLEGQGPDGKLFTLSYTNHWPDVITGNIGRDKKIGNSSGTIHAETACLLNAPHTQGAMLYVTDPPCPNCAKNAGEAGIAEVFIDHKGFDKDFAIRRGSDFENLSLRILEHAGISVFILNRKAQTVKAITEPVPPAEDKSWSLDAWHDALPQQLFSNPPQSPFAAAKTICAEKSFFMTAQRHSALGFSEADILGAEDKKYSLYNEPLNRILMLAARHGHKIDPHEVYSSRVPKSREQVNIVGAGLKRLYIGDLADCRDEYGIQAMEQLSYAGIIDYQPFIRS